MPKQPSQNPIQTTNLRAVSRDLRGIKKRHPYTADSIDQAVRVLEFIDEQKRMRHGPKLLINGLKIPLMPHRLSQSFNAKNAENGFYYESDMIKGLTFYINRKKGHIGIFDRKCGIIEIDFDRLPAFIAELMDIDEMYVDKED